MSKNNEKKKRNTKQQPYNVRSGYKKGPVKPKAPVRKTYRKTCTTATELFDMFTNLEDELITEIINPKIVASEEEIAEMYTEENILATMEENIVDYVLRTSIPNIATKENVHTSLIVKQNKVALQTNNFVGFGWNITTEKPEDRNMPFIITSIEAFVTLSGTRTINEKETTLLENGWVVSEN